MAKAANNTKTARASGDPGITPVDRLIMAMAAVVEDPNTAPRIRHLFLSQANGNLQVSLDMHPPAGD